MASYGDCTYGTVGGTYGNLCGTTTGGGLGRRGPYHVRIEGTVEVLVDDDELVLILHG